MNYMWLKFHCSKLLSLDTQTNQLHFSLSKEDKTLQYHPAIIFTILKSSKEYLEMNVLLQEQNLLPSYMNNVLNSSIKRIAWNP